MNKAAIKRFAIEARKKLMASVSDKAGMLGITEKDFQKEPVIKGADFEIYKTAAGTEVTLNRNQCEQRRLLVAQMEERGFEAVIEEVAYTWFNRICAIRFMEVNDYLPTRVRVLSSEKEGKYEPDLVTEAPEVNLNFTDREKEYIIEAKINNRLDDLFNMLFIKQCNKLHEILPELFEETEDYTEMLLNISYTNKDDVIYMLVNAEEGIPEADFNVTTVNENGEVSGQVEIIGWLYQYYNTELNDQVYDGNMVKSRVTKELLPAATTIYTPDWAIRYMVQNSLGKIWLESHPDMELREKWNFYLEDEEKLVSYEECKINTPEDILFIDPCMGSGHILVYAFDVLMHIYESCGYTQRDAAKLIISKNLYGLDVSDRAYQLSYFAVMMKGRQYNRRIFNDAIICHLYSIKESNQINLSQIMFFGSALNTEERKNAIRQIEKLLIITRDAKEYGSILKMDNFDWDLLDRFCGEHDEIKQYTIDTLNIEDTKTKLQSLVRTCRLLGVKYDVVVTNPPYLGNSRFSPLLDKYIKKNYIDEKSDLSMVVYKKVLTDMVKVDGFISFITTNSWLVLSRFEKLRKFVLENYSFDSIVDFGTELFEGKVGHNPITAWVNRACRLEKKITAIRLVEYCYSRKDEKEQEFFNKENYHYPCQTDFLNIPGMPIVYSFSEKTFEAFEKYPSLSDLATTRLGMTTADNSRFTRLWFETIYDNCMFNAKSDEEFQASGKKWVPYNKGGKFRKWYGNQDCVVKWENFGFEIKNFADNKGNIRSTVPNTDYYFLPCATWSKISSGSIAFRWRDYGSIFDVAGACLYADEGLYQIMGFLNSCVAERILSALSPTLNYEGSHIAALPISREMLNSDKIKQYVIENIVLAKKDWDSFEFSWNFKKHPLVSDYKTIKEAFESWNIETEKRFNQMKNNEYELNQIFIEMYGLTSEIDPSVEDKDISVRKADLKREVKSLLTYAVGCMLGRYSLDNEGIVYAGGKWNISRYSNYIPDADNIIPITDDEYFEDDIISKLCSWLKVAYSEETLEENLDYIAQALGNRGATSREIIRSYFIYDFYKEHCSNCANATSGKRPYYWMFDAGKENSFKAIVYYHRIDDDTVGKIRTDYLHKTQKFIESACKGAEYFLTNDNLAEKAKMTKKISKYRKQLAEIQLYDEAIAHISAKRIHIDIEEGIRQNYERYQTVEIVKEGRKSSKMDLLAKI